MKTETGDVLEMTQEDDFELCTTASGDVLDTLAAVYGCERELGETDEQLRARCQAVLEGRSPVAQPSKATLIFAGVMCKVDDWCVEFFHGTTPRADIQVTVQDEGMRAKLQFMACPGIAYANGATTFALVLNAPGYRVAADVAWFTHTEQPGGVFRFRALDLQVTVPSAKQATCDTADAHLHIADVALKGGLLDPTIEPAPEPAAPKSTVCPCGIHRADCEYHR